MLAEGSLSPGNIPYGFLRTSERLPCPNPPCSLKVRVTAMITLLPAMLTKEASAGCGTNGFCNGYQLFPTVESTDHSYFGMTNHHSVQVSAGLSALCKADGSVTNFFIPTLTCVCLSQPNQSIQKLVKTPLTVPPFAKPYA